MAGGRGREARVGGVKSPRLTVRRCGAGGWCGGCCFASAALLVLVLAFWGAFAQNRPEESPRVGSRSAESPKCSTGGAVPWPYVLVQKISVFVHPKWRGRIRALLDLIDSSFSLLARLVARTNAPLPPAGVDSLWMKVNPISVTISVSTTTGSTRRAKPVQRKHYRGGQFVQAHEPHFPSCPRRPAQSPDGGAHVAPQDAYAPLTSMPPALTAGAQARGVFGADPADAHARRDSALAFWVPEPSAQGGAVDETAADADLPLRSLPGVIRDPRHVLEEAVRAPTPIARSTLRSAPPSAPVTRVLACPCPAVMPRCLRKVRFVRCCRECAGRGQELHVC